MNGFLGFDAERLSWLRDAMLRSRDELLGTLSEDPAAAPAMCIVRRSRSMFDDVWTPWIATVLDSRAHIPAETTATIEVGGWCEYYADAGLGTPITRWMSADRLERALTTDPITAVAELAALLTGADFAVLSRSDIDLERLTERLDVIAAGPAAAAAFRATFDDWDALVTALATERLALADRLTDDPDDEATTERLRLVDSVLGTVGAVLVGGPRQAHRPAPPPLLEQLDPYAAAALLPHLDLDGVLLAEAATTILRRWHDWPSGSAGWMDTYTGGGNTADLVFQLLVADPFAATLFLEAGTERPETVFLGAQDPGTVDDLLHAGIDPARLDPARAGSIVLPLLAWLRENSDLPVMYGGHDADRRPAMAGVFAEWILYVGPRADVWGWSYDDGDDALHWVLDDDDALQRLLDALLADQRSLGELTFADTDGRIDDLLVSEQTAMFAQLEAAIADERLADAVDDAFWVDLAVSSAKFLGSSLLLPSASGITAAARDEVVSRGVDGARHWLESQHVLPATPEEVAARSRSDRDRRTVERAVIATVGVVGQLIELGELDPAVLDELLIDDISLDDDDEGCAAREISSRLNDWVDGLGPRLSPAHHNLVIAVRNGFLNQQGVDDICR